MEIRAAVARSSNPNLLIETLALESPQPHEILVRIAGVGICHTDIKAWKQIRPVPLPAVLGHEGSGIVQAVGEQVRTVKPGDAVVMTFPSCGRCANCLQGKSPYCERGLELSFGAQRADGSSPLSKGNERIHGPFFQQSSFATYALGTERNVVRVDPDVPIELLGPLGCGIQTGAGAVLNSLQARAGTSIAVFGAGSVGLSAVMAAGVAGCTRIIAVDVQPARLALARELGATHTINATETDPVDAIRKITEQGVHYALDATGRPGVFNQAARSIRMTGTCGLIGGMAPGQEVSIEANHLLLGRTLRGIIQGDSVPDLFIPRLIDLYRQGKFPFDKLITFFEFEQINEAVEAMHSGEVIKPVLRIGRRKSFV